MLALTCDVGNGGLADTATAGFSVAAGAEVVGAGLPLALATAPDELSGAMVFATAGVV